MKSNNVSKAKNTITILDYDAGNIASVINAFRFIGCDICIAKTSGDLEGVDALVIPGVGHFASAANTLVSRDLLDPLRELAHRDVKILGICLGFQLLGTRSSEAPDCRGLGFVDLSFDAIKTTTLKNESAIHIGFNQVNRAPDSVLFNGIDQGADFYFVHSYCAIGTNECYGSVGYTNFGSTFISSIAHGNIFGVQFHPEKSQLDGLRLLENFVNL